MQNAQNPRDSFSEGTESFLANLWACDRMKRHAGARGRDAPAVRRLTPSAGRVKETFSGGTHCDIVIPQKAQRV